MLVDVKTESRAKPVDIAGSELFRDLPDEIIARVEAMCRTESYPAETVIYREDEPSEHLWVLRSGRVRLVFTEPHGWEYGQFLISEIEPGQAFGWTTLSGQDKMMAQAVAVEDCEVYLIPAAELQDLMNRHVSFGYHVMHRLLRVMGSRLRDTRAQLRWLLANT